MTPATTLERLKEDVLIIVLSYLDPLDVFRIRSTCQSLRKTTMDKLLWIYILRRLVVTQKIILPPYIKSIELLDSHQIEAITIRAASLSHAWDIGELAPRCFARMDQPRSVTWLRLVSARWLFVSSCDAEISSLACYEVGGIFSRTTKPVAECFLSGPVQTAEIEMQDEGIVIALALGTKFPVVEVISLRCQSDQLVFVRLASLLGMSHIRLLYGDFVGCAMGSNVSIPHLANWRTGVTYALEKSPDENGCCLAMSFWLDYIVIAKPNYVQIFSSFTVSQHPHLLRTVPFNNYAWDILIVGKSDLQTSMKGLFVSAPEAETNTSINFLVTSEDNAYLYSLSATTFTMDVYHQRFEREEWPLRICIGSSGLRMAWISGQHGTDLGESPILTASCLHTPATYSGHDREPLYSQIMGPEIAIDGPETMAETLPSLWAFATFDMDEATGLLAVGNIFGELALYDYVGSPLEDLAFIGDNFTERKAFELLAMPQDPVEMDVLPLAHFSSVGKPYDEEQETIVSQLTSAWYKIPDADVPSGWSNDWQNWGRRWVWQGRPWSSDLAWRLEHSLHFLGRPEPLLYTDQETFFRAGGLYFFWHIEDILSVVDNKLSLDTLLTNLREGQPIATTEKDRSETGQNEVIQFQQIWWRERIGTSGHTGRNRWAEQQNRGGKPHPFLLSRERC